MELTDDELLDELNADMEEDPEFAAEVMGDEDPEFLEEDGEAPNGVVLVARAGLHLTEMVLAPEMDGRTPLGPRYTYNKADEDQVNPEREATEVFISWEDEDGGSRNAPTAITVPPNRTFAHWRYTSTSWRRPGVYTCVLRNAAEEELGRAPFHLVE